MFFWLKNLSHEKSKNKPHICEMFELCFLNPFNEATSTTTNCDLG